MHEPIFSSTSKLKLLNTNQLSHENLCQNRNGNDKKNEFPFIAFDVHFL